MPLPLSGPGPGAVSRTWFNGTDAGVTMNPRNPYVPLVRGSCGGPMGCVWCGPASQADACSARDRSGVVVTAVGTDGLIVGRARELGAVAAVLDLPGPGPAGVVVEGEAGIGKTTLLDAVARIARTRSFTVMACRPAQSETGLSFGALADLVSGIEPQVLDRLSEPQRRALDAVRLRRQPSSKDLERRVVGTALCSALEGAGTRTPVLIVVDDAQWLDQPSEEALRFAVRRLRHESVALVVSVRSGGHVPDPLGLDAAVPGGAARVVVKGLSVAALREVLSVRLGVAVARPVLVRLAQATGGNPFYALALTRALADKDRLDDPTVALPLPHRLHDLAADRIRSLDTAAAHACLVVAALARPTVDLLLKGTGCRDWAASGAAAAEDAGIIAVDREQVRFAHPLLRSAVYESAPPNARRTVHARLADLVDDPVERARHLGGSVPGCDAAVAEALDVGARHAWRRGAREVAAELAERALALTPSDDSSNRRRIAAAAFQYEVANPTRSRTLLQEVLDDHPTRAERLEAACHLGSIRFYVDRFEESIQLLTGVLEELHDNEHSLRARLETELTYTLIFAGDSRAALDHAETAVAAARALGDTALERAAAAPFALASLWAGEGVRTDMVELCLTSSDPTEPFAIDPQLQAGAVLKWGDELARARSVLTSRYELAQAQGAVAKLPLLAWQIGDVEVLAGRWEAAEALADEALEGARFREGMALALCAALRAKVHALRGRLDAARADADTAAAAARQVGGIALMAATEAAVFIEVCRGDTAGVHQVAGALLADGRDMPRTDPALLRWVPDEVEALTTLGDTAAAAEVLDRFEHRCRRTGRRSGWAAAHRCRALLASDHGALDAAADHIRASIRLFDEVGMPFECARSRMVAARVHRRARQKAAATAMLRQARATFAELGAPHWANRAADELDRVGGRRTGQHRRDSMTAVETEVARLVAAGLRNREVAAELFMSSKTVESHLTRIYRKLGARSRTELGAVLARREPPEGEAGGDNGTPGRH